MLFSFTNIQQLLEMKKRTNECKYIVGLCGVREGGRETVFVCEDNHCKKGDFYLRSPHLAAFPVDILDLVVGLLLVA